MDGMVVEIILLLLIIISAVHAAFLGASLAKLIWDLILGASWWEVKDMVASIRNQAVMLFLWFVLAAIVIVLRGS